MKVTRSIVGGPRRRGITGAQGRQRRRGLILVACVGVLGVISVMGLAFATVMRLESRAAHNYTGAVRAEFVARAGLEDAIARLRIMAREGAEFPFLTKDPDTGDALAEGRPADWYTWRGTAGGAHKTSFGTNKSSNWVDDDEDGQLDEADETGECSYAEALGDGGFYTLKVEDAASKINVNVGDNLGTILDNLCRAIGSPLHAADQRALVPRWFSSLDQYTSYGKEGMNVDDRVGVYDLFYRLGPDGRPLCASYDHGVGTGEALYGDGYAIAGYRARHGEFLSLEDVRNALTWIERGDGGEPDVLVDDVPQREADTLEEQLEVEAKFAAIKPYITIDSWNDTDQVGYGKFEQIRIRLSGDPEAKYWAYELTDRNACWNIKRNPQDAGWIPGSNRIDGKTYAGELQGCYVAIVSGVGQWQLKTIAANTADTIILSESYEEGSEMRIPPDQHSSYIILGRDGGLDEDWKDQLKIYSRQPRSFHRAPVNINTASDKVLTAVLMGLQTTWGIAGYATNVPENCPYNDMGGWAGYSTEWADAMWQCPSVVSVGRDEKNAHLTFDKPCPNDLTFDEADANQQKYGHNRGRDPFCFFCSYGHLDERTSRRSRSTYVNEAHYLAWQILKEREQTRDQDLSRGHEWANGYGPFRGWDDVFYRVFYPHEKGLVSELHYKPQKWITQVKSGIIASSTTSNWDLANRHPGIARLCMANFNSNTDLLKFQPNLEYIDRWGPNFTDLYCPYPKFLKTDYHGMENAEGALRVRPGELLDKSDLNVGTTEFCFDSSGVYDIVSIGRIYDRMHTVTAERKLRALVKVYDVWRESTQREFASGVIAEAEGKVGTRQAGQYAYDGSDKDTRKALATYPEAIVPRGHRVGRVHGPSRVARLAYDPYSENSVQPAGYDGQILLATNMYHDPLNLDPDISFYNSFTGDIVADASRGDPRPGWTHPDLYFVAETDYCPLDIVSLLGVLNSQVCDVKPTYEDPNKPFSADNPIVEGEGEGGDFRPDGLYMGVTGKNYRDGSFEFGSPNNCGNYEGAFTMWMKPLWHQGTRTCASLPISYVRQQGTKRGSTVCIANAGEMGPTQCQPLKNDPKWREYWPVPKKNDTYRTPDSIGKDARGYVRERFEHELWNAVVPRKGMDATNWRFVKCGDNSGCDSDYQGGPAMGRGPIAGLALMTDWSSDFQTWVPGHLAAGSDGGQPFYQVAPFRWTFIGKTWHFGGNSMDTKWYLWPTTKCAQANRGEGIGYFGGPAGICAHRESGQPQDFPTILGDCQPGYDINTNAASQQRIAGIWEWGYSNTNMNGQMNEASGGQGEAGKYKEGGFSPGWVVHVPFGHTKDYTATNLMATLAIGRPFVDGMITWNKELDSELMDNDIVYSRVPFRIKGVTSVRAYADKSYDFEDLIFEQYSSMMKQWGMGESANGDPSPMNDLEAFGMNRNISRLREVKPDVNLYQSAFQGTFATIDEMKVHKDGRHKNLHPDHGGFKWAQTERNKAGRYYFPVNVVNMSQQRVKAQIDNEEEPCFTSQDMYNSEQSQAYTFGMGEEDDEMEICTVRWTVFTPFFCIDKARSPVAGTDPWRFPFDEYFNSVDGDSRFEKNFRNVASPAQIRIYYQSCMEGSPKGKFTLADYGKDDGPIKTDIRKHGVASRYSSQRGCKVKIRARDESGGLVWFPRDTGDFYEHPEGGYTDPDDNGCTEDGWQQILLDTKSTTLQHPKCKPTDLKYRAFFRLSDLEYEEMRRDAAFYKHAALVDSPVFDDITIVCMRRPKVLEWRDVSE